MKYSELINTTIALKKDSPEKKAFDILGIVIQNKLENTWGIDMTDEERDEVFDDLVRYFKEI